MEQRYIINMYPLLDHYICTLSVVTTELSVETRTSSLFTIPVENLSSPDFFHLLGELYRMVGEETA